jgi:hypothetical protein
VFVFFITKWKTNLTEISYDLLMIASILAVLATIALWMADAIHLIVLENRFLMQKFSLIVNIMLVGWTNRARL